MKLNEILDKIYKKKVIKFIGKILKGKICPIKFESPNLRGKTGRDENISTDGRRRRPSTSTVDVDRLGSMFIK